MNIADIIKYRSSWHRWIWLLLAVIWIVLLGERVITHPYAISSVGVNYWLLAGIPFLLMLFHSVYPTKLGWYLNVCLFVFTWLKKNVEEIPIAYFLIGSKYSVIDFIQIVLLNAIVLLSVITLMWYIRPRFTNYKNGNLTSRSS